MDPKDPVNRLELALRWWEDRCFLYKMVALYRQARGQPCAYKAEGPLVNAPEFRKALMETPGEPPEGFFDRFVLPTVMLKPLGRLWMLPGEIAAWTIESRRIFRLSLDLQAMLNATSLDGVLWKDVQPPFDTFLMALPSPIKDANGREYDAVFFSRASIGGDAEGHLPPEIRELHRKQGFDPDEPGSFAQFLLLPKDLGELKFLSRFEREHILNGWNRKDWKKMSHWTDRALKRLDEPKMTFFGFMDSRVPDVPVTESVRNLHQYTHASTCKCGGTHPEWDAAARLFVGVCIHLSNIPAGPSRERSDWERPGAKSEPPTSLQSQAEVCAIASIHVLTPEERAAFLDHGRAGKGGYEVSAHFRTGHYRRPPGKGSDPLAEKVVWVRPTFVKRDRLKDGALTLGEKETVH